MLDFHVTDCLRCVFEGEGLVHDGGDRPDATSAASSAKCCVLGLASGMTSRTRDARPSSRARIIKLSGPDDPPLTRHAST